MELQTPLTSMRLSCNDVRGVEPCTALILQPRGIRREPYGEDLATSIDRSPEPPKLAQPAVPNTSGVVEAEPPIGQTIDG